MLQKKRKPRTSQYGEAWQKERQRLNQLNQQGDTAESTMGPTANSDRLQPQRGGVFVPVTWLSKCAPHYYSRSDPEWQEFERLIKDEKRRKALKSLLADRVCKIVSNADKITRVTGASLMVYGTWLDFVFPPMAPAQFECSGILWVGNELKWATRRFDDGQITRLHKVLLPTILFSSLQTFTSTLLKSHYGSVKSLWSWTERSQNQNFVDRAVAGSPSPNISQDASQTATVVAIRKRSSTPPQSTSPDTPPDTQAEYIRNTMFRQQLNSNVLTAAKEFRVNFFRQWRNHRLPQIRGACFLKGEIGVRGPKGRCKLFVVAVYLPKEDTFVAIKVVPQVLVRHAQVPPASGQRKNPPKI